MKDKILKNRIKIGLSFLILYILISSVSIATVIITDESITFNTDPLRIVRYNQTSQEIEIIENLTVNHLIVNGNNQVNGNNIINGNNNINGNNTFNGNSTFCNSTYNCFAGNCSFGNDTNYANFNESGVLTLHGEARVEKEVIFDMLNVKAGHSTPFENEISIGNGESKIKVFVYTFDPSKDEDVWFVWHTTHDLDPSENIEFHLLWVPNDDWVGGSYNWSLDYIIKPDNGANNTGIVTNIWENVIPTDSNNFIETRFSTEIIGATNDNIIFARLFLDSSESTSNEDAHVIFVEFKYWVNKLGERGFT